MRATSKGKMFAIYTSPIMESIKGPGFLPTYYKEYQDVFEKKNAHLLSQLHPYDCFQPTTKNIKMYLRRKMHIYFLNSIHMIASNLLQRISRCI